MQAFDEGFSDSARGYFGIFTTDPSDAFEAPEDGTYRVRVRDQFSSSHADPRNVYRLLIRPIQPDFRLVAAPIVPPYNLDYRQVQLADIWNPLLRKGGNDLLVVYVNRRDNFDKEVRISVEGLPPGVSARPITLGPAQLMAVLVLEGAPDVSQVVSPISVIGQATVDNAEVRRTALPAVPVWGGIANEVIGRWRLTRQLVIGTTGTETAPFAVSLGNNAVVEMAKGGTLKLPVQVTRIGDFKGKVAVSVFGLPREYNFEVNRADIPEDQSSGEISIKVPPDVLGSFSFCLLGVADVQYARNPEAAEAALARKATIEKLVAEQTAAAQATAAAKTTADTQQADAATKEAADKAAQDADAKAKQTTAFLQSFNNKVTELQNRAKPSTYKLGMPSGAINLKVTATTITIDTSVAVPPFKQGQKGELLVKINRLYGYADPVQLKVNLPGELKGIKISAGQIEKDQTEGKLAIELAADATVGTHKIPLQAIAKLSGQDLPVTQEITLTIEKAEPAK